MIDDDDDKTRIAGTPPAGGPPPSASTSGGGNALRAGFRLHEYEIDGVLGEGGFGIVYLARDLHLQRTVAIKEYMPSALASRQSDAAVAVKSERYAETFDAGLKSFVNEARLLAQFDQPALVKVHRFWEDHGTAYMVMPYYRGPTLKQWLREQPRAPTEAWLREMVAPLIEALQTLHEQNIFHRDIAPDNLLLLENGQPLLLDFGAARRIIGDLTQALTVVLKPGFAPIEQYAEVATMRQGPWTDVYALAATLYFAAVGRAPPPSVGRMMNDDCKPAAELAAGRYSDAFLTAIDLGLALKPTSRPQSMSQFRDLLLGPLPRAAKPSGTAMPPVARGAVHSATPPGAPAPRRAAATPTAAPRRFPLGLLLGILGAVVLGVIVVLLLRGNGGNSAPEPVASAAGTPAAPVAAPASELAPITAPAPAPVAGSSAGPSTGSSTGPAAAPTAAPIAEARPSPDARPPVSAAAAPPSARLLAETVYGARSPNIDVTAVANKSTLRINKDGMQFLIRSSRRGYLYVYFAGTDNSLSLLLPNAHDRDNRIAADTTFKVPRRSLITVTGPPGVDHLVFLVSALPRDFAPGMLRDAAASTDFDLAALVAAARREGPLALAGDVRCPSVGSCDRSYGAAYVDIEEVSR